MSHRGHEGQKVTFGDRLIAATEIHSKTPEFDVGAAHDRNDTSAHTESGAFIVNM